VSVDPLAGKFPFYTSFQYSGNNPVTFYDLDGNEQVDNTKTNVDQNGQQNKVSFTQEKPNLDEEGNVVSKTKEVTSVTQNEDGSFTLNHEKGTQFTDSEDRIYSRYSENFESPEFLSEKGKSLVDNLFENLAEKNIQQVPTISGSPAPVEVPTAGNVTKNTDLKSVERTSTSVGIASDIVEGAAELSRAETMDKAKQLAKKGYKIFDKEKQAFKFLGKISKFARGLGVVTGVIQAGLSIREIYKDIQRGGIDAINPWDIADLAVASLAVTASIVLMFTPIGWIAAAALITTGVATGYFMGRLVHDLATQ
jgi:hypothetical protein